MWIFSDFQNSVGFYQFNRAKQLQFSCKVKWVFSEFRLERVKRDSKNSSNSIWRCGVLGFLTPQSDLLPTPPPPALYKEEASIHSNEDQPAPDVVLTVAAFRSVDKRPNPDLISNWKASHHHYGYLGVA